MDVTTLQRQLRTLSSCVLREGTVYSECTSSASMLGVHMLPDLWRRKCGAMRVIRCEQRRFIHAAAPAVRYMFGRSACAIYKGSVDRNKWHKCRAISWVRSKMGWPFRILKRVFEFTKVCYRGPKKNHERLLAVLAPINFYQLYFYQLYQHREHLVPLGA
jgi:hypothetical protein